MSEEDYTLRIMNKLHVLTFFITQCEEEDPLEEDENEWHPDFKEAVESILKVNEEGVLSEKRMNNLNDMYKKWANRFDRLGLSDRPIESWETKIEDEIYDEVKEHYEKNFG
jgi:hypothetical protein